MKGFIIISGESPIYTIQNIVCLQTCNTNGSCQLPHFLILTNKICSNGGIAKYSVVFVAFFSPVLLYPNSTKLEYLRNTTFYIQHKNTVGGCHEEITMGPNQLNQHWTTSTSASPLDRGPLVVK